MITNNRHLFVEYRFHSEVKRMLTQTISDVARKFNVDGATSYRVVPHMALYYGDGDADPFRVASIVVKTTERFALVPFIISAYEWRDSDNGKVIAAHIKPSSELFELRQRLSNSLRTIYRPSKYDLQTDFWFHTTIAFQDIDRKFSRIWEYLERRGSINRRQYLTRITILNQKREIEYEYDLILKRLLNRDEALSRYFYNKTISRLRQVTNIQ